jgi:predicted PurR-regulated permease PerM
VAFFKRKQADVPLDVPETVPTGLRIAAAYSWRILLIAGVLAIFVLLVIQFRYIVIPFLISLLLAGLLVPLVQWLQRHRWPKPLAVTFALLLAIGVITGLVFIVVSQVRAGWADLQAQSVEAYDDFIAYLLASPFEWSEADVTGWFTGLWEDLQRDSDVLLNGIVSVGSTAAHVVTGLLLAVFALIFVLIDGARIWRWIVGLFPRRSHTAVDGAGRAGWITLTTFVRVQIFVAAVDAVGIGLGAWILGLFYGGFPLVIPIAVAVFLGSFVPIVGAVVTGALAVFVALVYLGPFPAVLMLAIVLLVQQVESHVLQPLVMGTAVKVHPLAVVFAVAAGGFTAGIAGTLFAVPLVAVVNIMWKYISSGEWRINPRPTAEDLLTRV